MGRVATSRLEFLGGCGDQLVPLLFGASRALGWRDHEATIPAIANIEIATARCRDLLASGAYGVGPSAMP